MYNQGSISKKNDDKYSATITTKDYRIHLKREFIPITNDKSVFSCVIVIEEKITEREILTIKGTLENMAVVLDNYGHFISRFPNIKQLNTPYLAINNNGCCYCFIFEVNQSNTVDLIICEYSSLYNTSLERLRITMDLDEIDKLMNTIYFVFLIDTEWSSIIADDNVGSYYVN